MTERDGGFTYLGLAPGKYYARVDSAQIARLNMESVPEHVEYEILPDFYGDIVYDLEFVLEQPEERVEETSDGNQENIAVPLTRQASFVETRQNELLPGTLLNTIQTDANNEPDNGPHCIQLGAFQIYRNARLFTDEFKNSFDIPVSITLENNLYKVKTETFKTRSEAGIYREILESKGWECFLVPAN